MVGNNQKKNLLIGRLDDVINIRGHRIGSAEIESTVLRLKEVSECSAISIEDDLAGHELYLYVVSNLKI